MYKDHFDVLLDKASGARVRSTDVKYNVIFEILDYVFVIIGPGGIYPPVYEATGELEQSMSITMWKGNTQKMSSLMGTGKIFVIRLHVCLKV